MKLFKLRIPAFYAAAGLLALLPCTIARAQLMFDVLVNTSALVGHPAGPFYLDFQLNDGAAVGDGDNTAILNAFNFGGGSAMGAATAFGGVTGNLSSTVTLKDSAAFNEFFQSFTPGAWLDFHLTLTTTVDAPTPDQFSFAILDSTLSNIPTMSAGSDAFMIVAITGENPTAKTFAGNPTILPAAGGPGIGLAAPSVTPVPEPSTYGLIGTLALLALIGWRRRAALSSANRRTSSAY